MRKFLKIFLLFLYFSLCFIFKGNFEAHIAHNNVQYYKNINSEVFQNDIQDNTALLASNNQEITKFQNNTKNNNSLDEFKKYNLLKTDYVFKEIQKRFSNRNFLASNFEHIIYTRAP